LDRSYGALSAYVASHALTVDGPIREYYLVGRQDTADDSGLRPFGSVRYLAGLSDQPTELIAQNLPRQPVPTMSAGTR
jgi:hypothetical protein